MNGWLRAEVNLLVTFLFVVSFLGYVGSINVIGVMQWWKWAIVWALFILVNWSEE